MAERGDVSPLATDTQLSPAHMRWMQWLPLCICPLPAAASAAPQLSWASGPPAQSPPGREGAEIRGAAGAQRATHFTYAEMGSQPL